MGPTHCISLCGVDGECGGTGAHSRVCVSPHHSGAEDTSAGKPSSRSDSDTTGSPPPILSPPASHTHSNKKTKKQTHMLGYIQLQESRKRK